MVKVPPRDSHGIPRNPTARFGQSACLSLSCLGVRLSVSILSVSVCPVFLSYSASGVFLWRPRIFRRIPLVFPSVFISSRKWFHWLFREYHWIYCVMAQTTLPPSQVQRERETGSRQSLGGLKGGFRENTWNSKNFMDIHRKTIEIYLRVLKLLRIWDRHIYPSNTP